MKKRVDITKHEYKSSINFLMDFATTFKNLGWVGQRVFENLHARKFEQCHLYEVEVLEREFAGTSKQLDDLFGEYKSWHDQVHGI